ncbi:MAG TPA: hypothetical protein VFT14_06080 [Solirubrobacterales bacterium]|nr:hypothetical protein [Solirubrobacterales bacterium]
MADPGEFLSRDEVLGGLPARRARTLLFLIEQHSALHASEREVGTMALLGERSAEARKLAWIEAFALGRNAPRTASIREIEAAAGRWAPLVTESAEVRAATLRLLAERHRLQYKRVPGIREAFGVDDERVAEAFERQTGEPLESIWAARIGTLDRLRWALSAPGRWLEQAPPFQASAALTFLLSMGQTVVIVPIAVATVGPLAAAASIAVIGLLALAATAAVAEATARNGEVRFRAGFFGRLVTSSLGPGAGAVPTLLGIAGVALSMLAGFIGLALLLNLAVPLPTELWVLLLGALAVAVPLSRHRTASFGALMALGLASIVLLGVLSILALVDGALSGGLSAPPLGPPEDIGLDLALGVIIGVLLGSYADPVYTVQIGRIVLPRDPSGVEYVRGAVAGMAAFILLTAAFSAALLFSIPAGELAGERGSALDTAAEDLGPGAVVLGVLIGIGLFGGRLYGSAIALFDFVTERLPGGLATRVVLRAGRGRVLLGRPGDQDATGVALAYAGMHGGRPQLELTLSGGGSPRTSAVPLPASGSEGAVEAGTEELAVEVIEADEQVLHLGLRTSMTVSYEDEREMLGPGVAESLLAGDEDARLTGWLLREGEANPADAARSFGWSEQEARERLQAMVDAGRARALESGNYVAQMAARRGRQLDPELWTRLGAGEGDRRPEAERVGLLQRAISSRTGRTVISSIPTAALAATAAALIVAGSASLSDLMGIVGIIVFATVSGVLPPMLVLAARRRSDVATARSRVLAGTALMVVTGALAIAVLGLHATILWSDPAERALAAAATALALASMILAVRHGAFKPAAVLELSQTRESGPVRIHAQEAGRDLEFAVGEQLVRGEAEFPLGPGAPPLRIRGHTTTAAELRISAQRLDRWGGAAALPITIELPREASLRMAEIGGMTMVGVEPGDWTVVVRPEEKSEPRALDRL